MCVCVCVNGDVLKCFPNEIYVSVIFMFPELCCTSYNGTCDLYLLRKGKLDGIDMAQNLIDL